MREAGLERITAFALLSAAANFSTVEMSGLGAPARTARPIRVRPSGLNVPGATPLIAAYAVRLWFQRRARGQERLSAVTYGANGGSTTSFSRLTFSRYLCIFARTRSVPSPAIRELAGRPRLSWLRDLDVHGQGAGRGADDGRTLRRELSALHGKNRQVAAPVLELAVSSPQTSTRAPLINRASERQLS